MTVSEIIDCVEEKYNIVNLLGSNRILKLKIWAQSEIPPRQQILT